jgi:hypothetical protein
LGPTTESVGHFGADLAFPVDEGEKVDRVLGATNSVQHRRKDLASVVQHRDAIAFGRWDPDDPFERASRAADQFIWRQRHVLNALTLHALRPALELDHSPDLTA